MDAKTKKSVMESRKKFIGYLKDPENACILMCRHDDGVAVTVQGGTVELAAMLGAFLSDKDYRHIVALAQMGKGLMDMIGGGKNG